MQQHETLISAVILSAALVYVGYQVGASFGAIAGTLERIDRASNTITRTVGGFAR